MSDSFKYRIVMFTQPGCSACDAMKPIWAQVAGEIDAEYPELRAGWGEYDVTEDGWEFPESLIPGESGQGTPEIAIFDEDCELVAFNGDGIIPASVLRDFIIKNCK